MELTAVTMDKNEARKRFLEYRASVRQRHNKEDEQIMRGYKALSQGHQVIDLGRTLREGGHQVKTRRSRGTVESVKLPNLAIMRADQKWCWVATWANGSAIFHNASQHPNSNATRNVVRVPAGTLPEMNWKETTTFGYRSMVPPVPPALRPADKLSNYHVLWEAEWERQAPVDPALLKHIGGDLYAVVAIWDLTELERTVLTGRFSA